MSYRTLFIVSVLLCLAPCENLPAQQPQNPCPMVEHTRAHPRLKQEIPPGRRETLELGTLFIPAKLKFKDTLPLFVHFHGGTWLPEVAAAKEGRRAMLSLQIGAGRADTLTPLPIRSDSGNSFRRSRLD